VQFTLTSKNYRATTGKSLDNRDAQGAALIDAVEALLRPLMPLFRNYGVTHHDLSQTLARLFVYDTAEILSEERRPATPARLALMTGLTRGEVEKHLSERNASTKRRAMKTSALMTPAAVLTAWNTDTRFSTPYGVAVDLSLAPDGRHRTFSDLVTASSPDSDPDAVLDQLLAAGCVEVHEQEFVRCTNRAYIPAGVSVERISRIGTVLGALAATLTHNLLEESSVGYLERSVQTDFPVSDDGRRVIREWLAADGSRFLETLDAWMTASRPELEAPDGHRVGVDIFMYDAPIEPAATAGVKAAANQ
jgi:hypothetical protein